MKIDAGLEDKILTALLSSGVSIWEAEDAIDPVVSIFDDIIATLRRDPRFKNVARAELDLLLADARTRAEQDIGELLQDTVDAWEAVRVIAEGLTL